jgi:boron transporter
VAQFEAGQPSGYLSIAISLLVLIVGMGFQVVGRSKLFRHTIRILLTDYGTILTIVFFTGFPHFGGELRDTELLDLPTSPSFQTTTGRGWLVNFWTIGVGNVFLAIPFAILLTILFYMDHNISVRSFLVIANVVFDLSRIRIPTQETCIIPYVGVFHL